MGNLSNSIKRFLSNKNTMTILLVIAGIAVLYIAYNIRLESAVSPVTVPIATREIGATEQITADDIEWVQINSDFVSNVDIITNIALLEGYYVTTGTSIVEGSLFYTSQVVEKSELPNSVFDDIPDGYTLFYLSVDETTTYGNSIFPGDRIDLYVSVPDEDSIVIFGKLVESIEVLAVRDSSFEDVFASTETGSSSLLLFAVPDDTYSLLMRALEVSGLDIIPVPRNKAYTEEGNATQVENTEIESIINSQTKDSN